jgi:hypothetical protein
MLALASSVYGSPALVPLPPESSHTVDQLVAILYVGGRGYREDHDLKSYGEVLGRPGCLHLQTINILQLLLRLPL